MVTKEKAMTIREAIHYLAGVVDRNEANANEPVFILRGQDKLAVPTVFYWAQLAEKHNVGIKKVSGAWAHAEAMAAWPKRKLPD